MLVRTAPRLTLAALGTTLLLAVTACVSSAKSGDTPAAEATTVAAGAETTGATPSGSGDTSGSTPASTAGAAQNGSGRNGAALQAAANAFTSCLRENGVNVRDITMQGGRGAGANGSVLTGSRPTGGDFPGGSFPTGSFPGRGVGGGGGFNVVDRIVAQLGLDTSDATVSAAVNTCTPAAAALIPTGGRGTTTSTTA